MFAGDCQMFAAEQVAESIHARFGNLRLQGAYVYEFMNDLFAIFQFWRSGPIIKMPNCL